jgi:hypothetical protein
MSEERHRTRWRIALLCIAGACFVLSAPCVFLGGLGLLGVVADVGVAENREFGWRFLRLALIPMGLGLIILLIALSLRRPKA